MPPEIQPTTSKMPGAQNGEICVRYTFHHQHHLYIDTILPILGISLALWKWVGECRCTLSPALASACIFRKAHLVGVDELRTEQLSHSLPCALAVVGVTFGDIGGIRDSGGKGSKG